MSDAGSDHPGEGAATRGAGPTFDRRRAAGLVVALAGAALVTGVLGTSAPRETTVSVGLSDFREGARRAERVSVSFAQQGEVLQRIEARFGRSADVPVRWSRPVSLAPGRYRVRVEIVGEAGIAAREEEYDLRGGEVPLRAPRE